MNSDSYPQHNLPSSWEWTKLGDVVTAIRGVTFKQHDAKQTFEKGAIPILRAGNIAEKLNISDDLVWVPEYLISEEQKLRVNDIVICLSSGSQSVVGKTAKLNNSWLGSVGAFCAILRSQTPEIADYLAYWFRGQQFLSWRDSQARGANIQNLRTSALLQFQVALPPLAEQKRIVGVLNEQMAVAERAKKAAVERLEAAQALREALLERVFDSSEALAWPETTISDLCVISSRQVDPRLKEYKDLPHVNGENIESGSGRILYLKSSAELGMRSGKYLFRKGDVLYSKLRPYLRKATVADFDGLCSADMYPLTPIASRVTKEFLSLVLLTSKFTEYADGESKRSRMPKLNRKQLMRWKQRIPPISRQRAIVERLNSQRQYADAVKRDTEETIAEIEAMPSALLRRAFSGEV